MNRTTLPATLLLALFSALPATPQSSGASMSADIRKAYETIKGNLTKTLDKMPESDYGFKPTPEIRSFAEVIGHVANAQIHSCAAVLGESKSVDVAGKTAKADLVTAMKESFTECDKAYAALTDANANEAIKTPRGQASRIGALAGNTTHSVEQYAILSVYMRLKNIVPPSSDK